MGVQYYMPTYVSGLKWGCGHSAQKKKWGRGRQCCSKWKRLIQGYEENNIVIGKWNWPQSDSFQENPIAKKCRLLSRIPSPLKEENFKTATKYALQL